MGIPLSLTPVSIPSIIGTPAVDRRRRELRRNGPGSPAYIPDEGGIHGRINERLLRHVGRAQALVQLSAEREDRNAGGNAPLEARTRAHDWYPQYRSETNPTISSWWG